MCKLCVPRGECLGPPPFRLPESTPEGFCNAPFAFNNFFTNLFRCLPGDPLGSHTPAAPHSPLPPAFFSAIAFPVRLPFFALFPLRMPLRIEEGPRLNRGGGATYRVTPNLPSPTVCTPRPWSPRPGTSGKGTRGRGCSGRPLPQGWGGGGPGPPLPDPLNDFVHFATRSAEYFF